MDIVGCVGTGGMGRENMKTLLNEPDSHVLVRVTEILERGK